MSSHSHIDMVSERYTNVSWCFTSYVFHRHLPYFSNTTSTTHSTLVITLFHPRWPRSTHFYIPVTSLTSSSHRKIITTFPVSSRDHQKTFSVIARPRESRRLLRLRWWLSAHDLTSTTTTTLCCFRRWSSALDLILISTSTLSTVLPNGFLLMIWSRQPHISSILPLTRVPCSSALSATVKGDLLLIFASVGNSCYRCNPRTAVLTSPVRFDGVSVDVLWSLSAAARCPVWSLLDTCSTVVAASIHCTLFFICRTTAYAFEDLATSSIDVDCIWLFYLR